MSSTNHRGRPTPAAGSGEEGRAVTRQRVVAAVGWPKSAASAWRRQRRTAMPMVPDASAHTFAGLWPFFNTLLVDSEALESGEALDTSYRELMGSEIDQFKRELVDRTGDQQAGDALTDTDILREAMNTVGRKGRLGEQIRCVVSVSMLTEGWDTNTVTHIMGVRAFGTQLLCEQVVGRGLRRQSYDLNKDGLFNVEYADILGIPFNFTAAPVVAPVTKPAKTTRVQALKERSALEITFPRVEG